jgi:hypothetical protein
VVIESPKRAFFSRYLAFTVLAVLAFTLLDSLAVMGFSINPLPGELPNYSLTQLLTYFLGRGNAPMLT